MPTNPTASAVPRRARRWLLSAALFSIVPVPTALQAQQDSVRAEADSLADSMYAVRLRDGSTVLGRIQDPAADPLVVETSHGTLRIPRSDMVEMSRVFPSSIQNGEYWPPSPNDSRLLFAPTGRMLKQGEGYFSNTYLFVQHVAGGVSNRFTLGAGMSLIPGVDIGDNVFYVTPKLGIYNSERTNVAVGVLAGYLPGDGVDGESFGILYGVSTFGSPDGHVTLGAGLGYANQNLGEDPVFMFGGEKRVSRRASLVTENYLFPTVEDDFNNIVSYGVRFFGEKLSVDLAFLNSIGPDTVFPGIPYVSFAVKF